MINYQCAIVIHLVSNLIKKSHRCIYALTKHLIMVNRVRIRHARIYVYTITATMLHTDHKLKRRTAQNIGFFKQY